MDYAIAALLVMNGLTALMVWRLWRTVHALPSPEMSLDRQSQALALLTDTTESGFNAVAVEMRRIAANTVPGFHSRASMNARVVAAAMRGDLIGAIAAEQQLSEGEVRLHLALRDGGGSEAPPQTAESWAGVGHDSAHLPAAGVASLRASFLGPAGAGRQLRSEPESVLRMSGYAVSEMSSHPWEIDHGQMHA
jgi:hypothetical protein